MIPFVFIWKIVLKVSCWGGYPELSLTNGVEDNDAADLVDGHVVVLKFNGAI